MTYPYFEEPAELDYDDTDLTEFLRHELEDFNEPEISFQMESE